MVAIPNVFKNAALWTAAALVPVVYVGVDYGIDIHKGHQAAVSESDTAVKLNASQEESLKKTIEEELKWAGGKGGEWLKQRGIHNIDTSNLKFMITEVTDPQELKRQSTLKQHWKNAPVADFIKHGQLPFSFLKSLQEAEDGWYQRHPDLLEFISKLKKSSSSTKYKTLHFLQFNDLKAYDLTKPLSLQAAAIAEQATGSSEDKQKNFLSECLQLSKFLDALKNDEQEIRKLQEPRTLAQRLHD